MPARDDLDHNATSRAALIDLVRTLSGADLNADLGDGWTVKVALAHLAFWDFRQHASLRQHLASGAPLGDGAPPALEDSDAVNNAALDHLAPHLNPAAIADLVVEAAEAVDAQLERTDPALLDKLSDGTQPSIIRRNLHREEHIAQINRGLGR
jgi:DinB superfamily